MLDSRTFLIYILRAYFLATSASVLIACLIPTLHKSFIPYGKTRTATQSSNSLFQYLSNITDPKAWFSHYYLISVSLSVFWAVQIAVCPKDTQVCLMSWLGRLDGRTMIIWAMMLVQGCRRLYESLCIQRPSSARMWIGHYVVGCAFYTAMSLVVLSEGLNVPSGTTILKAF